jgi:hypothetical protein
MVAADAKRNPMPDRRSMDRIHRMETPMPATMSMMVVAVQTGT